jgi:spore coat polysaccharide biosynthesis protein SpsF (cytidylyltransferase family)
LALRQVYRGDEDDVLARYKPRLETGRMFIVRVTGDCPLISPEFCGAVSYARLKSDQGA